MNFSLRGRDQAKKKGGEKKMLKKLLAGMLVVLFVVGVCGIANAGGHHRPDCGLEMDIEYDLDVDLDSYWEVLVGDNIEGICQDGDYNVVNNVTQLNGSNLLMGYQNGSWNLVDTITQDNRTTGQGMNVLTICQDGYANSVTNILQINTY